MANLIVDGFGTYGTGPANADEAVGLNMLAGAWAAVDDTFQDYSIEPLPLGDPGDLYLAQRTFGSSNYRLGWRRVLPAALSTAIFSFYLATDALPTDHTGAAVLTFKDGSNGVIAHLRLLTTGGLALINADGESTLASTSGPVIVAGAATHIELKIDANTGVFTCYVAGTKVIDTLGLTFSNAANIAQFNVIASGSGAAYKWYIGHLIVRDLSGTYNNTFPIGDRKVATLMVASDDSGNQGWTAQPLLRFGVGILDLSGVNAGVSSLITTQTDIGANDFTFEGQFRFQTLPTAANRATLFGKWDEPANERSYELYLGGPDLENGLLVFRTSTDGANGTVVAKVKWDWVPDTGRWYHVAMTRASGTLRLFIDGVQLGIDVADADTYFAGDARAALGCAMDGSNAVAGTCFEGWNDEFRLTIGAARYTTNFDPPTEAFPRNTSDPDWGSVKWLSSWDNAVIADDGPLALALTGEGPAVAITPNDGQFNYQVMDDPTPFDDTFLEAALIAATGTFTMTAVPTAAETVTVGTTDGSTAAVYTWVGTLAAAYDVLIGADVGECADNLTAAINAGAGEGTVYGTGTLANADVSAEVLPSNQVEVTALTPGTVGNAIASTETCANASWGGATLSGGEDIPADSQFGFERMPPNTVTVDSITLVGRQWKTDSGSGSTRLSFVGSGGAVGVGAAKVLGTTPNLTFDTIEEDPDTVAGLTATSILTGKVRVERTA